MTKSDELALEVLVASGLIVRDGSWYKFKENIGAEVRALVQESAGNAGAMVAMPGLPGKLPWLTAKGQQTDYIPKTPEARILCAFKIAKGLDWQDRAWDKAMFSRYLRPAKQLLGAFNDEQQAAEFLLEYGEEMQESGLDWGLEAAVRKAWNTRGSRDK